jgi:hypothetical protein
MRLLRLRFTLRRMMIAVAISAIMLGAFVAFVNALPPYIQINDSFHDAQMDFGGGNVFPHTTYVFWIVTLSVLSLFAGFVATSIWGLKIIIRRIIQLIFGVAKPTDRTTGPIP